MHISSATVKVVASSDMLHPFKVLRTGVHSLTQVDDDVCGEGKANPITGNTWTERAKRAAAAAGAGSLIIIGD